MADKSSDRVDKALRQLGITRKELTALAKKRVVQEQAHFHATRDAEWEKVRARFAAKVSIILLTSAVVGGGTVGAR